MAWGITWLWSKEKAVIKMSSPTWWKATCQKRKLSVRSVQKSSLFCPVKAHRILRRFSRSLKVSSFSPSQRYYNLNPLFFRCLVCLKYLPAASLNLKANIGCVHVRFFNLLERWMVEPLKTTDILQRLHWFVHEMTSWKRAQKFHNDDASLWVVLLIGCAAWEICFNQSEGQPKSG